MGYRAHRKQPQQRQQQRKQQQGADRDVQRQQQPAVGGRASDAVTSGGGTGAARPSSGPWRFNENTPSNMTVSVDPLKDAARIH